MSVLEAPSPLHERLLAAAGDRTYRRMGDLTGTHPETVRRYLQGQSPSVEFISAICSALEINGQWLLTGEGPMKAADAKHHALRHADPGELLSAIAGTLDTLGERLDRLELFVQGLEVRVRGCSKESVYVDPPVGVVNGSEPAAERAQAGDRARSIGDAIAQRSSQAAG